MTNQGDKMPVASISYDQLISAAELEIRHKYRQARATGDATAVLMRHAAADAVVRLVAALARGDRRCAEDVAELGDVVCDIRLLLPAETAAFAIIQARLGR